MATKPSRSRPGDGNRGDVTLDPFQLDALRPLLLEQELKITAHVDSKFEELYRRLDGKAMGSEGMERVNVGQKLLATSVQQGLSLRAGVSPHLVKLIDRVKAESLKRKKTMPRTLSDFLHSGQVVERSLQLYDYFVDAMVVVYAICLGVEINSASQDRVQPEWKHTMEVWLELGGLCHDIRKRRNNI